MWKCPRCSEEIEDQFDSCWKCAGPAQSAELIQEAGERPVMQCLRCKETLDYYGTKRFYEGGHFAAFMGDMFVNRECFDVYACPKCGHVEFFVDLQVREVEQA
jgi:Zn finger protein HypA/HybF involved in hydrogenase expression